MGKITKAVGEAASGATGSGMRKAMMYEGQINDVRLARAARGKVIGQSEVINILTI